MQQQAIRESRRREATNNPPYGTSGGGIPLRIENVSKTFISHGRSVEALRSVDLDVAAGEFVCFLGPSGCGKSTLLSIISGLEAATSGRVLANG
ncbi:MAG: ATP-binding cassette domain-containing protein, partial [Ktedonobacteraceae bacterium]|nr:ATP-binding cassette domain-containing protein [Ktedonobacteraceae bacterium]